MHYIDQTMLLSSINMMSGSYNVHKRKLGVCEGNNGVKQFRGWVPICNRNSKTNKQTKKKTILFCWRVAGEGGVGGVKEKALQMDKLQHESFHGGEEWFNFKGTSPGLIGIDKSERIKIQYTAASFGRGSEWLGENSNRWPSINVHYPRRVSSQIIPWQQWPNVFFLIVFFPRTSRAAGYFGQTSSEPTWSDTGMSAGCKWVGARGCFWCWSGCTAAGGRQGGGALPTKSSQRFRLVIGSIQKWASFVVLFL